MQSLININATRSLWKDALKCDYWKKKEYHSEPSKINKDMVCVEYKLVPWISPEDYDLANIKDIIIRYDILKGKEDLAYFDSDEAVNEYDFKPFQITIEFKNAPSMIFNCTQLSSVKSSVGDENPMPWYEFVQQRLQNVEIGLVNDNPYKEKPETEEKDL